MDTEYLKRHLGNSLVECLSEVSQKRPHDPIEYMAQWLRKHIENIEHKKQIVRDGEELERQQREYEVDQMRLARMKEEREKLAAEEAERKRIEEETRKAQEATGLPTLAEDEKEEDGQVEDAEPNASEEPAAEETQEAEQNQTEEPTEEQTEQPTEQQAQEDDKPPEEEQAAE